MKSAGTPCLALLLSSMALSQLALAQENSLRLDLIDPAPETAVKSSGLTTARASVPAGASADLLVHVVLESNLEPCASDPAACDGSENFTNVDNLGTTTYGCGDDVDNDSDGLIDTDDPDCRGVQGWSLSVATDGCFNVSGATVNGTAGGLNVVPPGMRDIEGSFAKTEVVDPTANEGLFGVVSAVVLSFSNPLILKQTESVVVLKIAGSFDATSMAAGETAPLCGLTIIPPTQLGLAGAGEPVKTAVTIEGRTRAPVICDLALEISATGEPTPEEDCDVDGDEDGNGFADCDDPVCAPLQKCQPGPQEDCDVDGDEDGNGFADCDDPVCAPLAKCTVEPTPEPDDLEQAAFRVSVLEPTADEGLKRPPLSGSGVALWTIPIAAPGSGLIPVRVGISLISRVEPCFSNPSACSGQENFRIVNEQTLETLFGCSDGIDNDQNGLVDADDPDCGGAQGWSVSVATEACFNVNNATTIGTFGDLAVRPPGIRDLAGSFARTEVVNPIVNGGLEGVVSAIVLAFNNPVTLPQTGESLILIVEGELDATAVTGPGAAAEICTVRVIPSDQPGLVGSGEPVKSAVTIGGRTIRPNTCDAELRLFGDEGPGPLLPFVRGNINGDSRVDVADPVYLVSGLFRRGAGFPCEDAADVNDDGLIDSSDAVYSINYLFGIPGGPPPPPPFAECGTDPTDDDGLGCDAFGRCS